MAQPPLVPPQPSAFLEYCHLDVIDTNHRQQIAPRKRILKGVMEKEMQSRNENMRTDDGKNFFILSTKKAKPTLTQKFLIRAYITFQEQENPERSLNPGEAERFIKHMEDCREKAALEKTVMNHKKSRPPEAFF